MKKLFLIDYLYIVIASLFMVFFSGGFLLQYNQEQYEKKEYEYTYQKELGKCSAFTAIEINISGDRYIINHHTKYYRHIDKPWADASIYPVWDCEAKKLIQ